MILNAKEANDQKQDKMCDEKKEMGLDLNALKQKEEELRLLEESLQNKLTLAHTEAEAILAQASKKSQEIEEEAYRLKEKIIQEAYDQQMIIHQQADEAVKEIRKSALDEKEQMLASVEDDVVEVMITLLQHIISEEMNGHIDWLRFVVKRLLRQEEIDDAVTLLVSPHTMEWLEKERESFIEAFSKLAAIEVKDTLNDTTCVLVTNQGNIEYDIAEGLNNVIKELRILKGLKQE